MTGAVRTEPPRIDFERLQPRNAPRRRFVRAAGGGQKSLSSGFLAVLGAKWRSRRV